MLSVGLTTVVEANNPSRCIAVTLPPSVRRMLGKSETCLEEHGCLAVVMRVLLIMRSSGSETYKSGAQRATAWMAMGGRTTTKTRRRGTMAH